MLECCILFVHYRDDPTTRTYLDLLRRLNPYPVVALCNAAKEHVDGALDVARLTTRWVGEHPLGRRRHDPLPLVPPRRPPGRTLRLPRMGHAGDHAGA